MLKALYLRKHKLGVHACRRCSEKEARGDLLTKCVHTFSSASVASYIMLSGSSVHEA